MTGENHSPKIARDIREGHLRGNALVQHVPSLRLGGIGTDQKRTSGAARLKVCVRLPPLHAWSFFFSFLFISPLPILFFLTGTRCGVRAHENVSVAPQNLRTLPQTLPHSAPVAGAAVMTYEIFFGDIL